jgi:hypothetical protein
MGSDDGLLGKSPQERAGDAAQKSAEAQAAMAAQMRKEVVAQGQTNQVQAMKLAQATPQELAALGRSYGAASQQLDRQQRLLDAIDPAMMEASKQALGLLRGETAGMNKPLTDMRNLQRQQLVNSLRSQYGPGAESSSVGQKALSQFDMQSNDMFAKNQQTSLAQAFGIATNDAGGAAQRGNIAQMQQVGQGYGALQDRLLNTQVNTGNAMLGALSGTSQQMIQSAGAPYVGQAVTAAGDQAMRNQLLQVGGMAAMYGLSQGGGGAASNPAAQNFSSGYFSGPNPYATP